MLQVIQNQKTGALTVTEVPDPPQRNGWVLVQNEFSLISAGTERQSVSTAKASMIGKAKLRPDLVRQVMDNVKREGLLSTYKKVQTRLNNIKPLGYSSAGVVLNSGVDVYSPGDFIACGGYAYHAEKILVPGNLCAKIPERVSTEAGAFATLGAIALQGVRQADLKMGEKVAVIGMGLLGQLTVMLIKANGCKAICLDIVPGTLELAKSSGADLCAISDITRDNGDIKSYTSGHGVDAVIITASTNSNQPVELAAEICRARGRIVIVGLVKADLPRAPFYEKEIDVKMSRSYGPGRYDPIYEEGGVDYPVGYVRWTEQRNMSAFLELAEEGKIKVEHLITHRIPVDEATRAYDIITGKIKEPFVGILLTYPKQSKKSISKVELKLHKKKDLGIGFIGAGNFAQSNLLPHLKNKADVNLTGVVTSNGITAKSAAEKFGFGFCSTAPEDIFNSPETDAVFIATRHDSHAKYVLKALSKGKLAYVEKQLCLTIGELTEITAWMTGHPGSFLMVGYNRRFSAPIKTIKGFWPDRRCPLILNYRVNAGQLDPKHWQNLSEHGGRIVGEGVHFIDVMQFITGAKPTHVFASCIVSERDTETGWDTANITIGFSDGSVGALSYICTGDVTLPKERLEVFGGGSVAVMDDFRTVILIRNRKGKKLSFNGKKGHREEMETMVDSLKLGNCDNLIKFDSLRLTSLVTLKAIESMKDGKVKEIF